MPDVAKPPPPAWLGGTRRAVPIDVETLSAHVRFDVAAKRAEVSASMEFRVDGPNGLPAFDLRQEIGRAVLDGQELAVDAMAHHDLGAGYDARMRVLDVTCSEGSRHRLDLVYELAAPTATGAEPIAWRDGGPEGSAARWDFWMSDLEPGRYLEMWLPVGLCHDRFELVLELEVTGTDVAHTLMANGSVVNGDAAAAPGGSWTVRYPAHYTCLSPLLVLVPSDEVDLRRGRAIGAKPSQVTVGALAGSDVDADAALVDATAWLAYFSARYGTWAHGDELVVLLWSSPRGMEYDGATTASPAALEHEVFHSWFGRGVKPASARDGWIDEAMATWATSSAAAGRVGRFSTDQLGLDEAPVQLCPPHPWARHTPRAAYSAGARLLGGVAAMMGGAGPMRAALADWHHRFGGSMASSRDLCAHLSSWCGRDLGPWWDRYVHGDG